MNVTRHPRSVTQARGRVLGYGRYKWAAEAPPTTDEIVAVYRHSTALDRLPSHVRRTARVDPNGEVSWRLADIEDALAALAEAGFVVLGLDTRTYDEKGRITEIPFADFSSNPLAPEEARDEALAALRGYDGADGDWVLVSWDSES